MYGFLLTLLILDAFILAAAVLMQAGKGGGVAASFGGASSSATSLIGTRQAGDLLTQISWWGGGLFIGLAFVLQLMGSQRAGAARSILDDIASPTAAPTAPASGGTAPSSAVPLTPAPTTPTTPPNP